MNDITPFTINYGMTNGFDLLWANVSPTSPTSFPEQDLHISNILTYNFLLFVVRHNICEEDVASCIVSTNTFSSLLENLVGETYEYDNIIGPENTVIMYNASINIFELDRPVSIKDDHTLHVDQCTTSAKIHYYLTDNGYVQLGRDESVPDGAVEVIVNTSTDSVIPLYVYGIR